jgi:energy-coupling factor transporter ATP-binding protein EcfA2
MKKRTYFNSIQEIHEKVFQYLMNEHNKDPNNFFFTVRKNNSSSRLEKGYWFHGNENYLSVSFWTGIDWKNKTPNVYFQVDSDKKCLFIFSAKDDKQKLEFARKKILPIITSGLKELNINSVNKGTESIFIFELGQGDYIKILHDFIHFIKPQIDDAIKTKISENEAYIQSMNEYNDRDDILGTQEIEERSEGSRPIGFIWPSEFKENIDRIQSYQRRGKFNTITSRDFYLKEVIIEDVGDIRKPLIISVPPNSPWVFLTGENGCGKTTILKAITSIFHAEIRKKYPIFKYSSEITFVSHAKSKWEEPLAFAAYGSARLISTSCKDALNVETGARTEPWYGIFHPDGILQGFEELRRIFKDEPDKIKQISDYLEDMFTYSEKESDHIASGKSKGELIPQLARVNFERFVADGLITYQEKDVTNVEYDDLRKFDELSSGVRSLFALFADILIKITELNRNEPDLSEFRAIVLIDEIDIHFHPSMQKQIIEILSSRLPKVQFIVTTHSPVTLLGAPENSTFYRIRRTAEKGITAERLTKLEKEIRTLLPNTILSSDIFDFDFLQEYKDEDFNKLRLEDNYNDIIKNNSLIERLKKVKKDIFPDNLFEEEKI